MIDILIFGAHPDDAEFGMGASMLKFLDRGYSLAECILTRGEKGTFGNVSEREDEVKKAAKKMGIGLELLNLKDCQIFDNYENRLILAAVIRKHQPRIIFAPYHSNNSNHGNGASHPDHTATGAIARNAARYARLAGIKDLTAAPWNTGHLFYYILPRFMKPSFFIDITDNIAAWEQIVQNFKTQIRLREGNLIRYLKSFRKRYGDLAGVPFAEAFYSEEPFIFSDLDLFL